eukprot:2737820-Prymnesium_polylepis.1
MYSTAREVLHACSSDADGGADGGPDLSRGALASEQAYRSFVIDDAVQHLGRGEDPRLFWHDGRYFVYTQQLVTGPGGTEAKLELSVLDFHTRQRTVLVPPEPTPSSIAPHGKN